LRQIITLLILVFVFFGCNQKQSVQLQLPQKKGTVKEVKIKEPKKSTETISIVEEILPIDIKESTSENINIQIPNPENIDSTIDESVNEDIKIDINRVKIRVALIYPSKLVEKYAKSSLNTISGYLSYQNADYELIAIDCETESYDKINSAFSSLSQTGITNVIALFTPNAINSLESIVSNNLKVYLPLIEKKDSLSNNESLIFGSISYEQQIEKLNSYSSSNNVMFYQNSYIGNKLKKAYDSVIYETKTKKEISKDEKNFRGIVNDYRLNNSSLYLNTDIVKTSLILSQIVAYNISPRVIFSTQLNYDPMIMMLTQEKDREKLIIANSIDTVNKELKDEIANFGGNIVYEWVDYSTLVGINYLYYGANSSLIQTQIVDNQAVYNPKLYKSTDVGFSEIK
jgi:hypothetical protein